MAERKGHFVTRGSGEVDESGKFSLNISHDNIVGDDGTLKEACYAQLHSASGNPCPAHDGLEASKMMFLSKSGEKYVLGLKQNLKFSPEVCVSTFFWHMPKFPLPPPLNLPPFPKIKKPCPPLVPVYKLPVVVIPKKPCPPKIAHKQPVVIAKKPCPPLPKPIYKPPVPIYKPPVPIYKPIYKPLVVFPKKPCPPKALVPIYKPPVVIPKLPTFPPKYIPHYPKFGKWPPFPSHP